MTAKAELILTLGGGGVMGLLVLLAAAAAGRRRLSWYFGLGGALWGALIAHLVLTDCAQPGTGPGALSDIAIPLFFAGLLAWPMAASWRRPRWFWRWLAAQAIMLLTVAPAFLVAVMGALCNLT